MYFNKKITLWKRAKPDTPVFIYETGSKKIRGFFMYSGYYYLPIKALWYYTRDNSGIRKEDI
jgi:hypothetical protein